MASNYAKRMARLSARILGHPVRPVPRESIRVLELFERKPFEHDKLKTHRYPPMEYISRLTIHLRDIGLFRHEHRDFEEYMESRKAKRGKLRVKPETKNKK